MRSLSAQRRFTLTAVPWGGHTGPAEFSHQGTSREAW